MPEIDFDPQHKRTSSDALEFERLKLKKDERARIVLLERPTFAYVHTLRAPKIVSGQAVKVEKKTRRGEIYMDWDMDFIGRPLCLGDLGILADKGVDATNCPACKRSTETDEINQPERRFAMNIIRYTMTRDGRLVEPFSCTAMVWGFTEGIYNRLVDIAQEHGALVGQDLLLGPCTDEGYQKYEIQAGRSPLWQSSEPIKNTVVATYQSNKVDELERACGRRAETRWMVKDIEQISERWRIARGIPDGTEAAGAAALTTGLDALLGDTASSGQASTDPVDLGGLLGATPRAGDPTPTPTTAATAPSGAAFDFNSLLDGLK